MSGTKHDGDKNRLELVDALAIEGLGAVLTFGAKKYADNNWRGGIEYSRIIGALKRHLLEIEKGEDIDPESGLPHIDHLGCCWMFLSNFMKTRTDLDNRWKINSQCSNGRTAGGNATVPMESGSCNRGMNWLSVCIPISGTK